MKAFIIILYCSILTACAADVTAPVTSFSSAAVTVSENAQKAYMMVNESALEQRFSGLAADPLKKIDTQLFKPVLDTAQENFAVRMQLLQGLNAYAAALLELSTSNHSKEIEKSAKNLYGSFVSINNSYGKATGRPVTGRDSSSAAIMSAAINTAGSLLVERKKRRAIKKIVIAANDGIQKACKLIAGDINNTGLNSFVKANLESVMSDYVSVYNRRKREMSFQERNIFIREVHTKYRAATGVDYLFDTISLSVTKMAEGHQALKEAVLKNQYNTPGLVNKIGEMTVYGNAMEEFYQSLLEK